MRTCPNCKRETLIQTSLGEVCDGDCGYIDGWVMKLQKKRKDTKKPQFLIGIPDGPIEYMEAGWAKNWINIFDNGGIGYQGKKQPTISEKKDIIKRIAKLKELLRKRNLELDKALKLML